MRKEEIAWRKIAAELKRTVPACKSKLRRLAEQELNVTSSSKENNNTQTSANDYPEFGNVSDFIMSCYDSAYESGDNSDEDEVMKEEEAKVPKDNKKNKKTKKTEKKSTLRSRSTDKKNASITKRRAPTNKKARN